MTTETPYAHPSPMDENEAVYTFLRDLKGDFRIDDTFVRVSRPPSYPEPELHFAIAGSREELDMAPVYDEYDVPLVGRVGATIYNIVHVCCGTDDVEPEMLTEWFARNNVQWLPSS